MSLHSTDYLSGLFLELKALPQETGWVEFKHNNADPEEIGEYISALSNSATLAGKANGYLIWGVDDATHDLVGTTFRPQQCKKGNEELESWLLRLLTPKIQFAFHTLQVHEHWVVILEISRAAHNPVQFQGIEYIRVGSYKKKLKDYPEKERELWRMFDTTPFEELIALEHVSEVDVVKLLDCPAYFDLLALPLPENRKGILARLADDGMIRPCDAGGWNITNMGGILFSKKLDEFKGLRRKAVRVVVYKSNNRLETLREQVVTKGYASGFEGLIDFINSILPRNEVILKALRKDVPMYPELAVREMVANAIIHQDFFIGGSGPMIEIFSDRMEITNPGVPLVSTNRFLDCPPRSRNEILASFMRRVGICEERGSGVDKVVSQTEMYQLPAPMFEAVEQHTRVSLYAYKPLNTMGREERVRACYLHACLKYVNQEHMTNATLRQRFGIEEHNSAIASRIIRDAIAEEAIHLYDPAASRKYAKYVPFWA